MNATEAEIKVENEARTARLLAIIFGAFIVISIAVMTLVDNLYGP
jgi:uncharacterized membrane protein